jgi:regulator of replication initiation timing
MKKQDIIRIINEEVEIALNEMYDPIYDSMIPEILGMIALGSAGVIKAVKYLKSKGLNKQAIVDVIKKAKSQMKDNVNENESDGYYHAIVNIFLENGLELQEDIPFGYTGVNLEKFIKELRDIIYVTVEEQNSKLVRVSIDKKTKPDALEVIKKHSDRIGGMIKGFKETQHTIVESINENEEYTIVYDKLNRSYEEYEEYEKTVKASSKEEAIKKVKDMDPRGKRHRIK